MRFRISSRYTSTVGRRCSLRRFFLLHTHMSSSIASGSSSYFTLAVRFLRLVPGRTFKNPTRLPSATLFTVFSSTRLEHIPLSLSILLQDLFCFADRSFDKSSSQGPDLSREFAYNCRLIDVGIFLFLQNWVLIFRGLSKSHVPHDFSSSKRANFFFRENTAFLSILQG